MKSLAAGSGVVARVSLAGQAVEFTQDAAGLHVKLPESLRGELPYLLKLVGQTIVLCGLSTLLRFVLDQLHC